MIDLRGHGGKIWSEMIKETEFLFLFLFCFVSLRGKNRVSVHAVICLIGLRVLLRREANWCMDGGSSEGFIPEIECDRICT